jgi:hypothetical protein
MFKGRDLFRGIQCPKAGNCDVLNCIFGHSTPGFGAKSSSAFFQGSATWADPTAKEAAFDSKVSISNGLATDYQQSSLGQKSKRVHLLETSDEEGDSKRKRLDAGSKITTKGPNDRPNSEEPQNDSTQDMYDTIHSSRVQAKEFSSINAGGTSKYFQPHVTSASVKNQPPPPSPLAPKSLAPKTLIKKESLNPRLVGTHPAPHTTRLDFLRLLHKEYERLNQILVKSKDSRIRSAFVPPDKLIKISLDQEENIAIQQPRIYKNAIGHAIAKLRKMGTEPAAVAAFIRT